MPHTLSTGDALSALLRSFLARELPHLPEAHIVETASLTADLGLDSMRLTRLSADLYDAGWDVDLMPWMIRNGTNGRDTLGSLVAYLEAAREGADAS